MYKVLLVTLLVLGHINLAMAEHPIDVEKLTAKSEYFEALQTYLKVPHRQATSSSTLAAAKSAWGLSLPDIAIKYFEEVLANKDLSKEDRARVYLSRGIIEYQEGRYRVATVYAEKVVNLLASPGALRGRAWQLWGESLTKLQSYSSAEEKLANALAEIEPQNSADVYYTLGVTSFKLGKMESAQESFSQVSLESDRAADAMKYLAQISIDQSDYKKANFWLTTGKEKFNEAFLDSWVDYALIRVAIENKDQKKVAELVKAAQEKYPASDHWVVLAQSAAEVFYYKERL